MGIMNKLLGSGGARSTDEYVELDIEDLDTDSSASGTQIHIARLSDKQDVMAIKDAVYDGDIVIADITRHSVSDRTMEHIADELKQVAREIGGDIVQKDDDQLILTPGGYSVSRKKLSR